MMDPYAAQEDIARRRQLLAQQLAMSQQTPIAGSNGLAQALAKLGTNAILQNNMGGLAQEEAQAKDQQQAMLADGLKKYFAVSEGTPDQPLPAGMDGPPELGKPADPKRAMIEALTSRSPELQALGKAGLASTLKVPTQEKFGHDPKSVMVNGQRVAVVVGDRGTVKTLDGVTLPRELMAVGDRVIAKDDPTRPLADFRPQYETPGTVAMGPDGKPIIGQRESGTGKVTSLGGNGTTVNVDTAAKASDALGVQTAKNIADSLVESKKGATSAVQALDALGNASAALKDGIKSGLTGEVALKFAKAAQSLGIGNGDPTIANTEMFQTQMAKEVAQMVKQFGSGTGISNADREFAEKAAGGQITMDPRALARLVDIAQQGAANFVLMHEQTVSKAGQTPGAISSQMDFFRVPFNFTPPESLQMDPKTGRFVMKPGAVSTPSASGASPQAPMSLDDYLNKKRGK